MRVVLNHVLLSIISVVDISRRAILFTPLLAATPPVFRGIYPIVQTPFLDDGSLDTETLGKETRFLLRCGVPGMAWPQLASEFWSLTVEERLRGAEALLRAGKGGRAKLVIGIQADDAENSLRLARHAAAQGADALISLPPAGVPLAEFFGKVAAAAPGLPLFLQAVGKITVDEVIALSKAVPAVRFVKDEAGVTLPRITEFRGKAPELGIFTGAHGRTMIDELLRGASGSMPAAGPADLYTKAFVLWEKGRRREAALAFARAAVLVPEFEQYGIEGLKYLLVLRGVFANHVVRGPRNGDVGAVATRTKLDAAGKEALQLLWESVSK
jgi:4-hydroxy-tetrahydrodipicolinate synthase